MFTFWKACLSLLGSGSVWQPWSQHPPYVSLEASIPPGHCHQQRPQDCILPHSILYPNFSINICKEQTQRPTSACLVEGDIKSVSGWSPWGYVVPSQGFKRIEDALFAPSWEASHKILEMIINKPFLFRSPDLYICCCLLLESMWHTALYRCTHQLIHLNTTSTGDRGRRGAYPLSLPVSFEFLHPIIWQ